MNKLESKQKLKERFSDLFELAEKHEFFKNNLELMLSSDKDIIITLSYYECRGYIACMNDLGSISDFKCFNFLSRLNDFYLDSCLNLLESGAADEK